MKKLLHLSFLVLILMSCNNTSSLTGTIWTLSNNEGKATLTFSDSTYIAKIYHDGIEEQKEYSYTIIGDTIHLPSSGSTSFKGIIKENNLIIYQSELIELPDTSYINTYELIYTKQ